MGLSAALSEVMLRTCGRGQTFDLVVVEVQAFQPAALALACIPWHPCEPLLN